MKMNKKGFTLAELLIVIAIIAILITIAITAFSSGINAARLAADHANIRNAYTLYQTGKMLGYLDGVTMGNSGTEYYFFCKDGTLEKGSDSAIPANAYRCQANGSDTDCETSYVCAKYAKDGTSDKAHEANDYIVIKYTVDSSGSAKWGFGVVADIKSVNDDTTT